MVLSYTNYTLFSLGKFSSIYVYVCIYVYILQTYVLLISLNCFVFCIFFKASVILYFDYFPYFYICLYYFPFLLSDFLKPIPYILDWAFNCFYYIFIISLSLLKKEVHNLCHFFETWRIVWLKSCPHPTITSSIAYVL